MGNSLVKLVQRKRKRDNSSGTERPHLLSSAIFKLNIHCFDELFEYLSLRDLHSLGQTCKSMQQMTGEFFTRNYSAAKFNCLRDGIYFIDLDVNRWKNRIDKCIPIPGFIHLITWVAINPVSVRYKCKDRGPPCTLTTVYSYKLDKFKYFKAHADELKSIKKLTLDNVRLNMQTVRYFRNILKNIEVLELLSCTVYQDCNDVLLKCCKNVRHIQLYKLKCDNQHEWLLQQYENLEHLDLHLDDFPDSSQRIDELSTFFELNPNIRRFSCTSEILLANIDAFLNCNVKLDTFELKEGYHDKDEEIPLWNLIYQLYTHGFYKYLHINASGDLDKVYPFPEMPFLKKISCCIHETSFGALSTHLIEYAERHDGDGYNRTEFLIQNLMNVERLDLLRGWLDIHILIQRLKNLKKIKLKFEYKEILELDALNREREKLAEAPKVTIYVPETIYLATKWATKNGITNFGLIEMKRATSYEWNVYDLLWPTLHLPKGFK